MGMLGINSKLYYRVSGTWESPTFAEIDQVSDLGMNAAWDKGDASARSSRIKKNMKTQLGLTFSGKVKVKPGNAGYEKLADAMLSDEIIDFLVLNGPMDQPGVRGWRGDFQVFSGNEDQALGNVLFDEFELDIADSDHEPLAAKVNESGEVTFAIPGGDTADFGETA